MYFSTIVVKVYCILHVYILHMIVNNLNNLLGNLNCKKPKDRTKNKTNFLVCMRVKGDTYIMIYNNNVISILGYTVNKKCT